MQKRSNDSTTSNERLVDENKKYGKHFLNSYYVLFVQKDTKYSKICIRQKDRVKIL